MISPISPENKDELLSFLEHASSESKCIFSGQLPRLPESANKDISYELRLDKMSSVLEHNVADQVICVESGISLDELDKVLAATNQFFPAYSKNNSSSLLDPFQFFPASNKNNSSSLLDLLNNGDNGPLEHGYGSLRDLILGISLALPSGKVIKYGGRVVKNVSGYDLSKLVIGARGSLGVILSAYLRLYARPENAQTLCFVFSNTKDCFEMAVKLRRSGLPLSCLEIIDKKLLEGLCQELNSPKSLSTLQNNAKFVCLMAIQIHGLESVLDKIAAVAKSLLPDIPHFSLSEELIQNKFWQSLANPPYQVKCIEIASPLQFMPDLLSKCKETSSELSWSARPGKNRLWIFINDEAERLQCLDEISKLSKEQDSALTLAYGDQNYLMKVLQLPTQDFVLSELKNRVKREYDPAGIMNPLVYL